MRQCRPEAGDFPGLAGQQRYKLLQRHEGQGKALFARRGGGGLLLENGNVVPADASDDFVERAGEVRQERGPHFGLDGGEELLHLLVLPVVSLHLHEDVLDGRVRAQTGIRLQPGVHVGEDAADGCFNAEVPLLLVRPHQGKGLNAEEALDEDGEQQDGERFFLGTHVVGRQRLVAGGFQRNEDRGEQCALELDDALLYGMPQGFRRGQQLVRGNGQSVQQRVQVVGFLSQLDPVPADSLFQVRHSALL